MAGYGSNNRYNFGQFFNKQLKKISNFGLSYDIEALQNSQAIGINEDPEQHTNMGNVVDGPYNYDIFSKKLIAKQLDKKSIAYLDRSYFDKRKILRQYSIKDEIRDFITSLADEIVIFDDENMFCSIKDLPDDFEETLRQKVKDNFVKIYTNLGFNDGITAWNHLKDLIIDGFIAFEIVYDKKQKNIIDLLKLDPLTLVPGVDPESGSMVWIQYPDNPQLRRILLDAQIVYISYGNNQEYGETSYVEPLIRPYNQLKLLEQTKLLYNINQASIYKKFIIPIGGLSRQQAEQQIYQLMSEYHEDVQWDDNLGTVSINGSSHIPHSKDIWLPSSSEGTPEISLESPGGNDLNEDLMLKHFYSILKKASKIPFNRFENESGGGNLFSDASEMTRDELKFHNFIKRIRTVFKEIILKPVKIQTMRDFPELINDHRFINSLNVIYNSNEIFEEWKKLANLEKRAQIASTLTSNIQDAEGKSYFSTEWIVRNIMKLDDEQIAENEKYKLKESGGLAINPQNEDSMPSGSGGDYFGGTPSGGGDNDLGGGETDLGGGESDSGEDTSGGDLSGGDSQTDLSSQPQAQNTNIQ